MSVNNNIDTRHPFHLVDPSPWPLFASIGAFAATSGGVMWFHGYSGGGLLQLSGMATIIYCMYVWWRDIVREGTFEGHHTSLVQIGLRFGMLLFIISEVMFFFAFFGALFYARMFAVPWLGGASNNAMTNEVLWPTFEAVWPLLNTPDGTSTQMMGWQGLPLINTIILLTSSVTLHFAHTAIEQEKRGQLKAMLGITILLGFIFLGYLDFLSVYLLDIK